MPGGFDLANLRVESGPARGLDLSLLTSALVPAELVHEAQQPWDADLLLAQLQVELEGTMRGSSCEFWGTALTATP